MGKVDAHLYFLVRRIRPVWPLHANRGFVRAFGVPWSDN